MRCSKLYYELYNKIANEWLNSRRINKRSADGFNNDCESILGCKQ